MTEQKKLAVLIDSDNISAKYAQFIMQEIEKYGIPTYKRVYGDWEKGGNGWHNPAINYSIMPVQQSSYIAGKNATDFSMIIDAMDILYTGDVDGFCLVTSDSDFTRLAIRLREAGKLVIGIGELKTPRPFTASCHHFCYLNQVVGYEKTVDEKELRKVVLDFVTENSSDDRLDLVKINEALISRYGNINLNEYGYSRFSAFIDSFDELKRSNTFVSLKKKQPQQPAPEKKPEPDEVSENDIVEAIKQYLEENPAQNDNLPKLESYITSRFGKVDYSRFGSKRFAKFIDKRSCFKRTGTLVQLVGANAQPKLSVDVFIGEAEQYARTSGTKGGNVGQLNNYLIGKYGKDYLKKLGYGDFRSAVESVKTVVVENNLIYLLSNAPEPKYEEITTEKISEAVRAYADANAATGGNIGQLNNMLCERFGKNYCADLGFGDYKSLLAAMSDVYVKKNMVFPAIVEEVSEPETPAEDNVELVVELPATEDKADINSVRRDVLNFVANAESGAALSALGKVLADKYGKAFLKELGFTSMRKLASEINGIVIRSNKLYLDEEFAKQTEEIEQFVIEFANGEGTRSVRSLGIQLRKRFDNFDFKNYGFAKFTDFINAIDGVHADRYHVKPEDSED